MIFSVSDPSKAKELALQFMLTAYNLCGNTTGLGFLQATNIDLNNISKHLDTRESYVNPGFTELSADYLAGRMVKTRISYSVDGRLCLPDTKPSPDHQGWSTGAPRDPGVSAYYTPGSKAASYQELLELAASRVGVSVEPV